MKKVVVSVIILAIILLMAPIFIGKMVSTKYVESLDQIATNPSVQVIESQFSPQWFSAQAITKLRLMGDLGELYPYDIILKDDIQFGPIIFSDADVHFNLAYSTTNFVLEEGSLDEEFLVILKEHLSLHSKVNYDLTYVIEWDLTEITKEHKGSNLVLGAMHSEFEIRDDSHIKGDYAWEGVSFTSSDSSMEIKGMELQLDLNVVAGNLYAGNAISTGSYALSIPEINFRDTVTNNVLSLKKLTTSAQTNLENNLLNSEMRYQIDEITAKDLTFTDLDLSVVFKNFDLDALSKLNDLFVASPQNSNTAPLEQLNAATDVINLLLAHKPEIDISSFNLATPDGLIESNAKIVFNNANFNLLNPMALLGDINADAEGKAPKVFLNKIGLEQLINIYTAQGFLRDENENVAFTLSLKNGTINLNDLVLPL